MKTKFFNYEFGSKEWIWKLFVTRFLYTKSLALTKRYKMNENYIFYPDNFVPVDVLWANNIHLFELKSCAFTFVFPLPNVLTVFLREGKIHIVHIINKPLLHLLNFLRSLNMTALLDQYLTRNWACSQFKTKLMASFVLSFPRQCYYHFHCIV